MLESISIQNFAVIKDLNVDLKNGLNIFTGETGAGKSVIIEAVSTALGSRADTSYVRNGCEKAVVTVVVDTSDCIVSDILEASGIDEDDSLIIRREINASGKSICRINGSIVPLSVLSSLCKRIADIHGQYDQQLLLDEENHINILDAYGSIDLCSLKEYVENAYSIYAENSSKLYNLKKSIAEAEKNRDFLKFQYKEIKDANIRIGEDEELEETIKIMQNIEQLYNVLSKSYSDLYEADKNADDSLGNIVRSLQGVSGYSKDIDDITRRIGDIYYELDDLNRELRTLRDSISYSQKDLDAAIDRIELLNSLKRKYGGSLENVLQFARNTKESLLDIQNADEEIKHLEETIRQSKEEFDKNAEMLSKERKITAEKLESVINKELSELNFKDAVFAVLFDKTGSTANGIDKVTFMMSANVGEDLKPIAKVASGGELSRVMLALKRALGDTDSVPTMIFDEIDTGISGSTAAVVGDKLLSIADNHQVICITHLPQIACKGSSHYRIEKNSDGITTGTTIVPLNKVDRIEEIARLLSGTNITDSARSQAKELLNY